MPAQSTSFIISTSVYLLSSALFLGAVYSPVEGSVHSAEQASVESIADGLQLELDALAPGIRLPLLPEVTASPLPVSISLHGHTIAVSLNRLVVVRQVSWMLPNLVLDPRSRYLVLLDGGVVEFEKSGFG